jgi:hypothetical protein
MDFEENQEFLILAAGDKYDNITPIFTARKSDELVVGELLLSLGVK